MTKIIQGDEPFPPVPEGTVITVGTFDGVHRGHEAVLEVVRRRAEELGAKSLLVTFEPHPLAVVRPEAAPRLLTTAAEKAALLERSGLDYVVFLPFTRELADFAPRRFVEEILIGRFALRHLVMGYDHGIGRGRSGGVDALVQLGAELGFGADVVPALLFEGAPVSSTRIREALLEGDVAFAARALGRPYAFSGTVVRGDGRGRTLGFPTANLQVAGGATKLLPREGIYAVRTELDGQAHDGVLHLGGRPTFPGATETVELYLFDFDREIYGEEVRVELCAHIRDIHAFESVDALVEEMHEDCAAARRIFAAGGGACQGAPTAVE